MQCHVCYTARHPDWPAPALPDLPRALLMNWPAYAVRGRAMRAATTAVDLAMERVRTGIAQPRASRSRTGRQRRVSGRRAGDFLGKDGLT